VVLARRLRRYPASASIALLCVATFAVQLAHEPAATLLGRVSDFDLQYAFIPAFVQDEPWRMVTGVFLHIAPWHLLNNVAFVLLLGSWLEKDIGAVRLAFLFAAGALAGELVYLFVDPFAIVLGASGGLMAVAAAALVMERKAFFARERRFLAGLAVVTTLGLGLVAPAISALAAHAVGALAGVVLGLLMPAPIGVRARNLAEVERATAEWMAAKGAIVASPADEAHLELRPTTQLAAGIAFLVVLLVLTGVSTIVQAGLIRDSTSATVAVVLGVWTVGAGALTALRFRRTGIRFDTDGFRGPRLKEPVTWSEVESLFPGRVYSGLAELGGVGFVRHDGRRFGIRSAGHPVRPLAAKLESIRLAAADARATTARSSSSS